MTKRPDIRILGATVLLALTLPLAACGENPPADAPATTPLPNVSEDRIIDGVVPSDQVQTDTDPTPQSSTGGSIPGHTPGDGTTAPQQDGAPQGGTGASPAGAPDPLPAQ
ncbi:hypothetical protein EJC49_24330 [Aquibium carbonis]|uniref:Uncharacterized protein n=1 Tax=Aquibium carbonis TaxID=2495581 RepID=A0A3R9ZIY8_9HYPH|nr:hypothetical protein [Aquibium carbonis]RST80938.1 hypothetical protein EJC49_24330 [Aquibium carbonis]